MPHGVGNYCLHFKAGRPADSGTTVQASVATKAHSTTTVYTTNFITGDKVLMPNDCKHQLTTPNSSN